MMVVMTVMMIGGSVSRYYRTGKNDKGNDSKKQRTQLHAELPLDEPPFRMACL
jgi:hypothetical protein